MVSKDVAQGSAPSVLIVGTGPAGLFAACELIRHGVRPRIVEQRLSPHHEARGTALQPAVLEIIDRAGLIEPFLRAGVRIRQGSTSGPRVRTRSQLAKFRRHRQQVRISVQPAAVAHRDNPARTSGKSRCQDRIRHRGKVDRRRPSRPACDARKRRTNGGFHGGIRSRRRRRRTASRASRCKNISRGTLTTGNTSSRT